MATETTGIDMEQNYVTVTVCIINWQHGDAAIVRCGPSVRRRPMNFYDRGFVASGFDERDFSEYRAFWSRWLRGPYRSGGGGKGRLGEGSAVQWAVWCVVHIDVVDELWKIAG